MAHLSASVLRKRSVHLSWLEAAAGSLLRCCYCCQGRRRCWARSGLHRRSLALRGYPGRCRALSRVDYLSLVLRNEAIVVSQHDK